MLSSSPTPGSECAALMDHYKQPAAVGPQTATPSSASTSSLFMCKTVDVRDEIEEHYERAYQNYVQLTAGLSDKELHEVLASYMAKDQQHEEISHGFIYALLTEPPPDALKTYRDVTLLTRDGLHAVTQNLSMLVADKYPKLVDAARKQLLWLTKELIKNGVANVDSIMWCLLRQAAGGDVSQANMFLVEALLDICTEYRYWLEKLPMLVAAVVYTFVRLIEDHSSPMLSAIRTREVKFVVQLIRDRFGDVIPLGRDFIRILQNVARIPEMESLWRDMLNSPKTLYPTFTGVWQILKIRTSRRFLQLRLTPEIERKILFMTNNVKFGSHKRYQDWFQARYFTTMESHSLRSDLIRFIINAIHPSNDMLSSDLIPRWAIIGWLLTSSTNVTATANSKLALFYDWLFFDAAKDSIMNIEPGILVMYHSIRNHPLVSSTLLDFLCRIVKNFFPKHEDKVRAGVYNSLRNILEKQVIPNLFPLFESPRLDAELRQMIRDNFREFCTGDPLLLLESEKGFASIDDKLIMQSTLVPPPFMMGGGIGPPPGGYIGGMPPGIMMMSMMNDSPMDTDGDDGQDAQFSDDDEDQQQQQQQKDSGSSSSSKNTSSEKNNGKTQSKYSKGGSGRKSASASGGKDDLTDDDDDLPLSKVRLKEKPGCGTGEESLKVDLPASINASFDRFVNSKSTLDFESFVNDLRTVSSLNQEQEQYVHSVVVEVVKASVAKFVFPADAVVSTTMPGKEEEQAVALRESLNAPLFVLYKLFVLEDKCKKCVQNLAAEVYRKCPMAGCLLLYFLKAQIKLAGSTSSASATATNATSASSSSSNPSASSQSSSSSSSSSKKNVTFRASIYRSLCSWSMPEEKLEQCLGRDLVQLERAHVPTYVWLLPDLYREFSSQLVNNEPVLRLTLGAVDARNLRDLIYAVSQGRLLMLKADGLLDCVRHSLAYETFEQVCLWQLLQAHDIPMETFQDVVPELDAASHAEALTYMLLLLRNEEPTAELIRLLLSREAKGTRGDHFVTSVLRYWCQDYEEKLSEYIANLLNSKYPNSSPNKRKRPAKNSTLPSSSPTSEQLLGHLEHFRRSCQHGNGTGTGLYVQDAMQRALQQAFSHSNDNTKKQYSDLFGLAAEDETSVVGRRGASGRGRKPAPSKKTTTAAETNSSATASTNSSEKGGSGGGSSSKKANNNNEVSSDEDTSEDEWTKGKNAKRRKKVSLSDSD